MTCQDCFMTQNKISDYTLEESRQKPLYNWVGRYVRNRLKHLKQITDVLKDKALLVLDKCWDVWEEVYDLLKNKDMLGQAIFKFYIENEDAYQWAGRHPDCMFVPMLQNVEDLKRSDGTEEKAPVPALEILPEKRPTKFSRRKRLIS